MSVFQQSDNNIKFCQYFKVSRTVFEFFVSLSKQKYHAKNRDQKKAKSPHLIFSNLKVARIFGEKVYDHKSALVYLKWYVLSMPSKILVYF